MRLWHFTATDDNTQPIEYVVISDDAQDDVINEYGLEGYELRSSAHIEGSEVDIMPRDRPLFPN